MSATPTIVTEQPSLRVLVIDDAFDHIGVETLPQDKVEEFLDRIDADPELLSEVEQSKIGLHSVSDLTDEILAALQSGEFDGVPIPKLSRAFGDFIGVDLIDRGVVQSFAERLGELPNVEVKTLGSIHVDDGMLDEIEDVDYVFLDYYLGSPPESAESRSIRAATQVRGILKSEDKKPPMLVLMSSRPAEAERRAKYVKRTSAVGATFFFLPKEDLDDKWKVERCLTMLKEAEPYAAAVDNFAGALKQKAREAVDAVVAHVLELEIADYSYLQRARLLDDGHPLGDYLAWLLSHQFTHELFERRLSDALRTLDRTMFGSWMLSQRAASPIVGELFQSAVYERELAPLGPHPRYQHKPGGDPPLPHIVLGDVFRKDNTEALVVMTAACDLAIGPDAQPKVREPNVTSVLLLAGKLLPQDDGPSKRDPATVRTDVFPTGDTLPMAVEWDLNDWRSIRFGELQEWLRTNGYETVTRARLRPLFALGLQQAFHAHRARIGLPKSPPFFWPVRAELWWNEGVWSGGDGKARRVLAYSWDWGRLSLFRDSKNRLNCAMDVSFVSSIRQTLGKQLRLLDLRIQTEAKNGNDASLQTDLADRVRRVLAETRPWDVISREPQLLDKTKDVQSLPLRIFESTNPRGTNGTEPGLELHIIRERAVD